MELHIKKDMNATRYKRTVLPLLSRQAKKENVIGDLISDDIVNPQILIRLNYESTNWTGPAGHSIQPQHATKVPEITIDRIDGKEGLISVLMIDLDKIDIINKTKEQWCVYYVANVAVGKETVILNQEEKEGSSVANGDVVFEYVPLLTPHSTPKEPHRYAVVVLSQEKHMDTAVMKDTFANLALTHIKKAEESGKIVYKEAEQAIKLFDR